MAPRRPSSVKPRSAPRKVLKPQALPVAAFRSVSMHQVMKWVAVVGNGGAENRTRKSTRPPKTEVDPEMMSAFGRVTSPAGSVHVSAAAFTAVIILNAARSARQVIHPTRLSSIMGFSFRPHHLRPSGRDGTRLRQSLLLGGSTPIDSARRFAYFTRQEIT